MQFLPGEVKSSELVLHGYVVALEELSGHHEVYRVDVESDGAFRFQSVPFGDYILRIENYYGDSVQESFVTVDSHTNSLTIRLAKQQDARPPSGAVSAARLAHPPSKKAYQAFVAAQKYSESGDYADAARQLEHAIELSPDYSEAYTNLGAQYVRMGRYQDAVAEIGRALEINRPNAMDLSNLACAQFGLQQFDRAEHAAVAALKFDPQNRAAHFIMGMILARDRRTLRESVPHLEFAAETSPSAKRTLETVRSILSKSGD